MESENILNWLRDSPAFQGAPPEALQELAEGFEPRTIEPGEVVVSEGDSGGEFFMPVSYTHLTLPTTPY